jgi:hypothetical protein
MSKTKSTTSTTEPFELEKTLLVDGQEYNVNAVHATQVDNTFTVKQVDIAGEIPEANVVTFNGSADADITIVPAAGGKFSGPIKVGATDLGEADGETVLNYGDVSSLITDLTGSGWYTWNGTTFNVVSKNDVNQHLGIVVGNNDNVQQFASYNKQDKYLPMYLYISSDTGNVFYGTSEEPTATQIAVNATRLSNAQEIQVNLASTSSATLDGNGAETALVSPGITGTLPLENGGTGGTTQHAAAYNIFKDLHHTDENAILDDTKIVFEVTNPSTGNGVFYTKSASTIFNYIKTLLTGENPELSVDNISGVLGIPQGGTGATTNTGAITNIINGNDINPKTVTVTAGQYMTNNAFGINMQNSDVKNANGIYFSDYANSGSEGLCFARNSESNSITDATAVTWDRFYAYNGNLWFAPNSDISTEHKDNTSKYTLYHTGNLDSNQIRKITFVKSDSSSLSNGQPTGGSNGDIVIVYD